MTATADPAERRVGMGAIVHSQGVAFRVWAPNAFGVSVIGDFNDWSQDANPMECEGNGYWYADVPGAQVGQGYRYLIRNGDQRLSRVDPYVREVTNSIGNGIIHDAEFDWEGDEFALPPWNELVIYELHIGTFNDKSDDKPGTFQDAIERLPHLKRLGVNVVQVMPIAEFAGDYSWGYNPAHIFAVESIYGGPRGFQAFVKAAHQLGIGVVLDVVYNHLGPSDLNLWQFDGWSENGLGGIYFYNDWRCETPWGKTRPDYGRGEVRQYLRDNALMWLEDYHVDGLRMDMTLYIRTVHPGADLPDGWSLAQWINREISCRYPGKITIAEDLQHDEWLTKAVEWGVPALARNGTRTSSTLSAPPSSRLTIVLAPHSRSAMRSVTPIMEILFSALSTANLTTRSPMVKPACHRKLTRRTRTTITRRSDRRLPQA